MDDWRLETYGSIAVARRERAVDFPEIGNLLSVTAVEGVIDQAKSGRRDISADDKSKYLVVAPGDVVYNTMRMWQGVSGHSSLSGIVSPAYTVVQPDERVVDGGFLAHLMKLPENVNLYRRFSQGLVSDTWNLKFSALASLPLAVPPLDQQRRIAEILDTIDESMQATERVIAKLRTFRTGLVRRSVKDAEEGTGSRSLSEVLPTVEYGISAPLGASGSVPVLRMGNLQAGSVDVSELRYTGQEAAALPLLRVGDVLFNRTNSIAQVGKTAIWRGELPRATFASYLVRLTPSAELLPDYLNLWMNTPETQNAIRRWATTAIQQVNINPTNLRRCEIRVPPIDAQKQVVSSVAAFDSRLAEEAAVLSKLRRTRDGLATDLLSGRVRTVFA